MIVFLGVTPFPAYDSGYHSWESIRAGNGVRNARVWAGLLGVEKTTIERVEFDEDEGLLVAHVRPMRGRRRLRDVWAALPGL